VLNFQIMLRKKLFNQTDKNDYLHLHTTYHQHRNFFVGLEQISG
jgi:hypothetical protein